ncbi:MAG TPA: glutathione S-transferase family protein [Baekduia sp.]|uniref:glutathione S-transferase family protein n=1 Tax=Baekduia sp. TaxID=2600305 RepID=UPI002D777C22|nr:glutathione S-transferase family protein [Baekduia sp.]HET6510286.1 glutathione S-transferase family protein [Baekduia sp.]
MRLYDYAASANAYKVRLLLAELGRDDVERVAVDIFDGATLTDGYVALNPSRTVPVLELDDGRTLPESGAILWHLAEGTPLLPDDRLDRAQVLRWLLWEQADLVHAIAGLRFRLMTGRLTPEEPAARARHAAALEVLALLDDHLRDRPFLVGDAYTIADVAVYGYAHVASDAGLALEPYPAVVGWLGRVASRPAYMNDLVPYPPNASVLAGRSIYG